jgi:hypothetical protein
VVVSVLATLAAAGILGALIGGAVSATSAFWIERHSREEQASTESWPSSHATSLVTTCLAEPF